jgi:hypothetical protein
VQFDLTWNPDNNGPSIFETQHRVFVEFGSGESFDFYAIFDENLASSSQLYSWSGSILLADPVDREGLYPVLFTRTGILGVDDSDEWERLLDIGNPDEAITSAPVPSALILACTGIAGIVGSRRRWYSNS